MSKHKAVINCGEFFCKKCKRVETKFDKRKVCSLFTICLNENQAGKVVRADICRITFNKTKPKLVSLQENFDH